MQLASESKRKESIKTTFFWVMWGLNAVATATFGATYLPALFRPLAAFMPGTEVLASLLAVIASLAVFDAAYKAWQVIGRTAETSPQRMAANLGEWSAFVGSLAYTVIVMSTFVFPNMLTRETTAFLQAAGGIIFIGQVALHLILMKVWMANGVQERRLDLTTEMTTQLESEKLAYQKDVMTKALLKAKGGADKEAEDMAHILGQQWSVVMVSGVKAEQKALPPITEGEAQEPPARHQPAETSRVLPESDRGAVDTPNAPEPPQSDPWEEWEEIPVTQEVQRIRPTVPVPSQNGYHPH
jgi:hypothetical protein